MGLFDFLKSEKKKQAAARKAAGTAPADYAATYTDAVNATRAAAERMAAAAPPKAAPGPPKAAAPQRPAAAGRPPHTPTPSSAAHKAVPAAPAPEPGPAAGAAKRTYTVRKGDTLMLIARRELGNEARWRELYAVNRAVIGSDPHLVHPGQVLTLPG
ncbi:MULTISPECIES: LysM peptidoglycan-binding domain-containing protein [Streptomyces]|uniref:LysM peptidoglycan-binding domain-containing protein n=1 Tax=Streptomyces TaxID=1883 RepID=UPI0016797CFA|nr:MULTISPECIES: LysM peptidoglycan-binding domain-containing protein [Streptomyces]MBD3574806.1 LysM peptidoglycan-binding domain-containing protein [Streptomyces sp. KD18]GGS84178.1 hypothetical protein GCM10010286_06080 [Streptomyces toxytricini]